jgi:hypothetical protein
MRVKIRRSPNPRKKFRATLEDGRFVDFGARGYSDYTKHKNPSRKKAYLLRHGAKKAGQKWGIGGIDTAGFWSRWYLWSEPTIKGVERLMSKKFGIEFRR